MKKRLQATIPLTRRLLGQIARAYEESADNVTLPWLVRYNVLFPEIIEREMTLARRERRVRVAFRDLQRRRYLEMRGAGSTIAARLTDKGRRILLLYAIRNGKRRTDGGLLLVSFDIPEQERNLRDRFTRKLRLAGLKRLHKSLWVTDKDVASLLKDYLDGLGTTSWIRLFDARAVPKN